MTIEQKNKIIKFLSDQVAHADFKAEAYVFDENKERRPKRSIYKKLDAYLETFLSGDRGVRWVTLTGLRGAGKTTLLSQLYYNKKSQNAHRLFLSVDQIKFLDVTIYDVLSVYEELIGQPLEALDKPLLLFLDEVQYEKKWGLILKNIYDKANNVFIFATGSSAVAMNKNTDIARRTIYEKLFPLNFCEYLEIKEKKTHVAGLKNTLREVMFSSKTSQEVYAGLVTQEQKIKTYFLGISDIEIDKYINFGSLPFMIALKNESLVYDQINKTLDRVINVDIANEYNFSSEIVSRIPAILYAVADMDVINYTKLSSIFEISRPKVMEIFEALESTETLLRISPYASHLNQARRPSKYLFSSPAFRSMYYKLIGNIISEKNSMGKLYEDLVGMYLHRILYKRNVVASLTYDSAQGGADFIFSVGSEKIVIEVGVGNKDFRQVLATANKSKPKYSIIISGRDELEHSSEANAVKIPLKYFLLT